MIVLNQNNSRALLPSISIIWAAFKVNNLEIDKKPNTIDLNNGRNNDWLSV